MILVNIPEFVNRKRSPDLETALAEGSAFAYHKKQGQPRQLYRTRWEPQMDGGGQLVANQSLATLGSKNLASQQTDNMGRRMAAQEMLELNPSYDKKQAANRYGYINQILGKEVHHELEIDTFIRLLRSASPEAQIKGAAALLARDFHFSDHPSNQIALWGDPKNVPGPRTSTGMKVPPPNHPGVGEHQTNNGVHQRVDRLHDQFNLPDTNKLERLERYVQALTPEQQASFIELEGLLHRKAVQDVKGTTKNTVRNRITTVNTEDALARTLFPVRPEIREAQDNYVSKLLSEAIPKRRAY